MGLFLIGCGAAEVRDVELGASLDRPEPPTRRVQTFELPSRAAVSRSDFELTEAFPALRFRDPVAMIEVGDRFYVAERGGRVYSFDRDADARDKELVLDISAHVMGASDSGLLAIAAHPEFLDPSSPRRGHLYAFYAHSKKVPDDLDDLESVAVSHQLRLSRFTIPAGERRADPSSELVLIEQHDQHLQHQGGGLFFHPVDGFLYLSIGDEGGYYCRYKTCQRNDVLFGGVLRIDVDQRGGDVSHPIRKQPADGVTDHYYIPSDNPFVDDPDALEEMYAIGLRNPFRMAHDPVDDQVWIGDVGQEMHEEINVLRPGANYQWNVMEGFDVMAGSGAPEPPYPGIWTHPVHAYERSELRAIIGGLVYRGAQLPSLYGRYVHADFRNGNIWAAAYEIGGGQVEFLGSEVILESELEGGDHGITGFAADSDGALYVLSMGKESRIMRLDEVPERIVGHTRLSETQLFDDLEALRPAEGLLAYEIVTPLWSDGSIKQRFVAIPEGQEARYAEHEPWALPEGTVLVKHFGIALDEREPERIHKLETRVLIVDEHGSYGATYRWRDDQSDADLLLEHLEEELRITGPDGDERTQPYIFPSPGECIRCHRGDRQEALGLRTAQLNGSSAGASQLLAFERAGIVGGMPERLNQRAVRDALPRLAALDDEGASLELRARSYLDANCSFCHGMRSIHGTHWDARLQTPLERAHILNAVIGGFEGSEALRVITPGAPQKSAIYMRAGSEDGVWRMPPLGSARPDRRFLELLADWIVSLD